MRCLDLANGSIQRKQKDFSSMIPPPFYYCCLWLWLLTTKQRGAVICMYVYTAPTVQPATTRYLRSLYLRCDMSTNFVFEPSYLAILP